VFEDSLGIMPIAQFNAKYIKINEDRIVDCGKTRIKATKLSL